MRIWTLPRDWLEKARRLLLTLDIYLSRNINNQYLSAGDYDTFSKVLMLGKLIGGHMSRCQDLSIDCSSNYFPTIHGEAPILKKLRVTSDFKPGSFRLPVISLMSLNYGVHITLNRTIVNLVVVDWSRVTHFEGSDNHPRNCGTLFKLASNLACCRMTCSEIDYEDAWEGNPPFSSESLRSLKLEADHNTMHHIVKPPTLPALTHLELDMKLTPLPNVVVPFLQGISSSLISLKLSRVTGNMRGIFYATPLLRELDITLSIRRHCKFTLRLLSETSVVSQESADAVLPNLQLLTIRFKDDIRFPWTHIRRVLGRIDDIKHPRRRPLNTLRIFHDWDRTAGSRLKTKVTITTYRNPVTRLRRTSLDSCFKSRRLESC